VQCFDERVHKIAMVAAEGIKTIIQEEKLQAPRTMPFVPLSQPMAGDAMAPAEEQEVVSALENDAPFSPPRKLKVQVSDASTCAPSCVKQEQEEMASESASCADTEVCSPEQGRRHPRRPRTGRRAKARARRELWEAAKRDAFLEDRREGPGDLCGAILACIVEDESEEERRCREGDADIGTEHEDSDDDESSAQSTFRDVEEAGGGDEFDRPDPFSRREDGDDGDDDYLGQLAPKKARKEYGFCRLDSQCSVSRADARQVGASEPGAGEQASPADDSHASVGDEDDTNECSSVSEEEGEEIDDLANHELWKELGKGAELLPTSLVGAMIRLQKAADIWQAHNDSGDLKLAITNGVSELRPRFRRIKAVVTRLAETWDCPQYLSHHWIDLHGWLLEGEYGPCWQRQKFDELREDCDENNLYEEAAHEWMQDEIAIRSQSLQDGWDHFVKIVGEIELADVRKTDRERKRADETKCIQEAINDRLAVSMRTRRVSP